MVKYYPFQDTFKINHCGALILAKSTNVESQQGLEMEAAMLINISHKFALNGFSTLQLLLQIQNLSFQGQQGKIST